MPLPMTRCFKLAPPPVPGAANFWINGGTILNKGVEAVASFNGRIGKVRWTPTLNFSKNVNQIRELSNLLVTDRFVLNNSFRLTQLFLSKPGSATLGGRAYGSYGDIFGRTYVRNDKGGLVYNTTGDNAGLPQLAAANDRYLGNSNPNFLLGFNNSFNYKNLIFSFCWMPGLEDKLLHQRNSGLISRVCQKGLVMQEITAA